MLRVDGKLCRRTLGEYPTWSLSAARKEALRLQREAADAMPAARQGTPSKLAGATRPAASVGITYDALVTSYTELHLKPNTRAGEKGQAIFRQDLMQPYMACEAAGITKAQIVSVLDKLVAAHKPHGAANLLKSLRAMFAWAVARDDVPANPCAGVRPPVRGNQRERVLTDAEIVAVLGACDKVPAPFGAMVRMLLHTGARRNEVAQAKWSEFDGNVWTVPAERSKNGKANVLPLPPAAMAILDSLPRYGGTDNYVFTTTKGLRPSSDFSKRKIALDAASGTSGWRLHDLRRTCRTKMSQLGVSRETARRVLSHSVDSLDARYDQHNYLKEKQDALSLLAEHLSSLTS